MPGLKREGLLVAAAGALCALVLGAVIAAQVVGIATVGGHSSYWTARMVPAVLYLGAIVAAAWAGWQVSRGRAFALVIPRLLSTVGILLALAATIETFGMPFLMRWLTDSGWHGVGIFDPSFLAIGCVGLLLWLIGRLMRRAVTMAEELDGFV